MKDDGELVCLIKPQFEAGREKVGKKGVVRDQKVHLEVVEKVSDFAKELGFAVLHLDFSPIKGPEGNIEYLIHLRKQGNMDTQETKQDKTGVQEEADGRTVVEAAHAALDA